jgi:hypothetical protein
LLGTVSIESTMKLLKWVLAILIVSTLTQVASTQVKPDKPWTPAVYHGLVMGRSTRAAVIGVLGKPKWVGHEQDTGAPILVYDVTYPFEGLLTVYIGNGVLESLALEPKVTLAKNDITRLFGRGYITVHYSVDDCLGEGGAAPIYEDPKGPIMHMEYRDRGLAAVFNYNNVDKVEAVIFISKPFGLTHSLCTNRGKK